MSRYRGPRVRILRRLGDSSISDKIPVQSLNVASRTLIGIPLIRLDYCDQGIRLGKESCQVT
jgi:hypothetical protein